MTHQKMPSFQDSIADNYEKYFAPILFNPAGKDLASRLPGNSEKILEVACGTGAVTRSLIERFPDADITATDIHPAMIGAAQNSLEKSRNIQWEVMNAQEITFEDNLFDTVVCQFSVMFFPDKQKAIDEVYRVLKPGGTFIFNTFDIMENNPMAKIMQDTLNLFFPKNPVTFLNIPFSMTEPDSIKKLMENSGFKNISIETIKFEGQVNSGEEAAKGFILGTPTYNDICERDETLLPEIINTIKNNIAQNYGPGPFSVSFSELVSTGVK